MANIEKVRRRLVLGALLRLSVGARYLFVPERMAGRLAQISVDTQAGA
jgi:hypothetical protein